MGPIGDEPYDPLRHYTAVEYDTDTGLLVVSNGIQTQAIYETYKLLYNVGSAPTTDYMKMIMEGAAYEPDSLHTPRIAGTVTRHDEDTEPVYILGIIIQGLPAQTFQIQPEPGSLIGISTYKGNLENPEPFDPNSGLPKLKFEGRTATELAEYLFTISDAVYNEDDIRVCSIGGIRSDDNHTWNLAIRNRHQK